MGDSPIGREYAERGFATVTPRSDTFLKFVDAAAGDADFANDPRNDAAHASFRNVDGVFYHAAYPHVHSAAVRKLIASPEIAEILKTLYGPDPVYVTHSKFSYRFADADQEWLPHQDSGYKPADRTRGTTFCVHLEDVDASNGALQVFPGSHKLGRLPHVTKVRRGDSAPQTWIPEPPDITAEHLTGAKGTILAMTLDTIHQSGPNRTGGNRKILIFEVEPVIGRYNDEHGRLSIVLNGAAPFSVRVRSVSWCILTLPYRVLRNSPAAVRLVRWLRNR